MSQNVCVYQHVCICIIGRLTQEDLHKENSIPFFNRINLKPNKSKFCFVSMHIWDLTHKCRSVSDMPILFANTEVNKVPCSDRPNY